MILNENQLMCVLVIQAVVFAVTLINADKVRVKKGKLYGERVASAAYRILYGTFGLLGVLWWAVAIITGQVELPIIANNKLITIYAVYIVICIWWIMTADGNSEERQRGQDMLWGLGLFIASSIFIRVISDLGWLGNIYEV